MINSFVLIVFLTVSCITVQGQVVGDSHIKANRNWNQANGWQRYNGSWQNNSAISSSANGVITVLNGHTTTVTVSITVDQLVAEVISSINFYNLVIFKSSISI